MDLLEKYKRFAWYDPEWVLPTTNEETKVLLSQCAGINRMEFSGVLGEVIARSNIFPIPLPINSVKLEILKERRPVQRLRENIAITYPLLHERVVILMANFLRYKREFGSSIEKELYMDMSVPQLIDRLLKRRAVCFVGAKDSYRLFTRNKGLDGWETIGTPQQKPPLVLSDSLSYDEIKLSALLFVSGPTECINNGTRNNKGVVNEHDIEEHAIIIGAIGPRLKRPNRMDWEDMLITAQQNTALNGYGEEKTTSCLDAIKQSYNNTQAKRMWRHLWADFYQVPSVTFEDVASVVRKDNVSDAEKYEDRYVWIPIKEYIFDNEVFYKRIHVLAEMVLMEAEARAKEAGRDAFINVVGCGLGAWKASPHQADVYVLAFLERVRRLLQRGLLPHVADVNLSYIEVTPTVADLFSCSENNIKKMFLENARHPKGGITASLWNREPSSRLQGDHKGKLLVMTYPWDGNAHPGNEFWSGNLKGSGDSAAASSTQVAELHNAYINLRVGAGNTCLVTATGLHALRDYYTTVPA